MTDDLFDFGKAPRHLPPIVNTTAFTSKNGIKPTAAMNIKWTAKDTAANTIYADMDKVDRDALEEAIMYLYLNRNQPCSTQTVVLDQNTKINSTNQGTGTNGATTWRDFIEGIYQDKVKGRDFSQPQFRWLTALWKALGWPPLKFTKTK